MEVKKDIFDKLIDMVILFTKNNTYELEGKYKDIINPKNVKRGKNYHLDHKYSIFEGFNNGVSPKIIGQYYNLEIMTAYDNLKKNKQCSITLNELLEYEKINKRIGD